MMIQSTEAYHPSKYTKIRGSKQTEQVPANDRCHKCQQRGSHWINNCPLDLGGKRIKRSSGIPRTSIEAVEGPLVPDTMVTPDDTYSVLAPARPLVVPPPATAAPKMPPPSAPDSPMSASETLTKEAEQRMSNQRWDMHDFVTRVENSETKDIKLMSHKKMVGIRFRGMSEQESDY